MGAELSASRAGGAAASSPFSAFGGAQPLAPSHLPGRKAADADALTRRFVTRLNDTARFCRYEALEGEGRAARARISGGV